MNLASQLKCPHCGERGLSLGQKLCLGPARATECSSCGEGISVPWSSMLVLAPVLLIMLVTPLWLTGNLSVEKRLLVGPFVTGLAVLLGLAAITFVAWTRWVPLIKTTRSPRGIRPYIFVFGAVNLVSSSTLYLLSGQSAPLCSFGLMGAIVMVVAVLMPKAQDLSPDG